MRPPTASMSTSLRRVVLVFAVMEVPFWVWADVETGARACRTRDAAYRARKVNALGRVEDPLNQRRQWTARQVSGTYRGSSQGLSLISLGDLPRRRWHHS
jgi:hypothetical protein